MKRILLSVAVLAMLLNASCSKTTMVPDQAQSIETSTLFSARVSGDGASLPTSTLPSAIKTYLDQNAAGYTLIKVEKKKQPGTTTYWGTKVTVLQNGVPVDYFFDTNGAPTSRPAGPRGETITRLTASQLPASVSSYLSKTYSGYQLVAAESMQISGAVQEYRVQILTNNQRMDIHFDGTGTFRDAHTAPGNLGIKHSVSYVSRNDLPSTIQTTLTSTYGSYTYGWAEQHVHDSTMTYDVKLFNSSQPVVLHFNTAGAQVAPAGPGGPAGPGPAPVGPGPGATPPASDNRQIILDATKLPAALTSYLQANFSGYTFLAAELNTPPTETSGIYKIDLAVGKQLYKLRFSASGELIMAEVRG